MAEIPDFRTIALQVLVDLDVLTPAEAPSDPTTHETRDAIAIVAAQLRSIWNARGAADLRVLNRA